MTEDYSKFIIYSDFREQLFIFIHHERIIENI